MPGQWTSIETNFPTFTGEEPVNEKISQLHNYMFILTEQLKYNLSNLDKTNWNATALQQLTAETSSEAVKLIAEELEAIAGAYARLNASVANLSNTVNELVRRSGETEERLILLEYATGEDGPIQQRMRQLEEDAAWLEQEVSGEDGLVARMGIAEAAVEALQAEQDENEQRITENEEALESFGGVVAVDDTGATIGAEGQELRLVGKIYINGVLYGQEQEEGNETS